MNTPSSNKNNTHIFTNRGGNTLIKEFEGILHHNPQIKRLDAVVGFLRASGYFTLRPFLNNIAKARVLIGIDVDRYIVEATRRGKLFLGAENEVKEECLQKVRQDIERSAYRKEVEEGIRQMAQDLKDGKLELRAHPSRKIHAKLYILYPEEFNQYTSGIVITGSSNLSGNGLGITQEKQYEFNVKMPFYEDVQFAKSEFEVLWEEAKNCEINASDVTRSINQTYLKGDLAPYDLYIKMLMEYFSDRILESDHYDVFDMPTGYTSYDYQTDAVIEGYQKLIRYDGFFLADVVGLGKTVVATMIAKKFLVENGTDRTKILVVYPPAVEQNWKATFKDFGIDKYTRFISYGRLNKVLDEDNYDYWDAKEYDLILVDEAHKFRNNKIDAFKNLQTICKSPRSDKGRIPGNKKKVVLISATPMNNSPEDLLNQILLFQDARYCTIDGVGNLTAFFKPLIEEFKKLRNNPETEVTDYDLLAEKIHNRLIKPITVRRTRTDIESVPRYKKDVLSFPKVLPPIENRYELNEHMTSLFEKTVEMLDKVLSYASYQAIAFLTPKASEGLYENAQHVSRNLAGIRKNGLVKLLESSFNAFTASIERFCKSNGNMIYMYENDKIFIAPSFDLNKMMDSQTLEDIEKSINNDSNDNNRVFSQKDFRPEFIQLLRADQKVLEELCLAWGNITDEDDSKFAKFAQLLDTELFNPSRNPSQKLVLFSESVETIKYLERRLNRSDVLAISSVNRKDLFKTIRENFDANYKKKSNEYRILLSTDVLAEGVNLHRSNVIVNYDTPWNSTRLMQRIGRVNRIGSSSKEIYNYVFYPSPEGNRELNLMQIAISKLQTFHIIFGEDNQVYSQKEVLDSSPSKLFDVALEEEKKELNQEIPYYEELRELYKNNRSEYNRIAKLSLRSRTGRSTLAPKLENLSRRTLVFLKTNFRKVFYLVGDKAEEIDVLEALGLFKALPSEKPIPRIEEHHQQVAKALNAFHTLQSTETISLEATSNEKGKAGAQVNTALNLLASFLLEIHDDSLYKKVANLRKLVERGTLAHIPKELQKMQKMLRKGKLSHDEAFSQIVELAKQYEDFHLINEGPLVSESEVEIILSESFL